jgi:hypothetical protein
VVQHVLREPAVGGDAGGAMALGLIAVVQTRGVFANETVIAPAAAVMRLDTDLVADGELIHRLPQSHHRPRPLMPRRKGAVRQGGPELPVVNLKVAATGATHGDLDQNLAGAWVRHRALDHADVLWAEEDGRAHGRGNRLLFRIGRHCQGHDVLRRVWLRWRREASSFAGGVQPSPAGTYLGRAA